jgi:toxin FitB
MLTVEPTSAALRALIDTPFALARARRIPSQVLTSVYLVDTNVVSETRRSRPHGAVLAWLDSVEPSSIFVPAVVLGELQGGIERTREQDPVRASELERWLERVTETSNVLSMDQRCFREWAGLMHRQSPARHKDAMIAAVAKVHRLTVVTRNARDFHVLGVPVMDPFRFAD